MNGDEIGDGLARLSGADGGRAGILGRIHGLVSKKRAHRSWPKVAGPTQYIAAGPRVGY